MSNKKYTHTTIADETLIDAEVKTPCSGKRASKERFLKGPIPLSILQRAGSLPGKALAMYLAIRHRCDLQGSNETTVPTGYLESWGISKDTKKRALDALEGEGLVAVERQTGRTTRVSFDASGGKDGRPALGI